MPITIAAWNVNSVKARLERAVEWVREARPDVLCLQELKCTEEAFPRLEFEDLGYNCAIDGQKTYNGVAVLSRFPIEETVRGLPGGDGDDHARYLEAVIATPGRPIRVVSIYAPNGNPAPGPKFDYKLSWLDRLVTRVRELLTYEEILALAGDYNIIPTPEDCDNPPAWMGDALFFPESRAKYRELLNLGLTGAFEQADGRPHQYTFWDYQAGSWQRNHGIRIDHILLSPEAADRLKSFTIHHAERAKDRPSDHVPVVATLEV
jgi:exodeoxyribonuclease-3